MTFVILKKCATGEPAWTWNEDRKQFYFHNFLPEMPDLNLMDGGVKNEIKVGSKQRPILNFAPRGKLETLTPGAKLYPRGEFCPLGLKLSPGDEILCSPLHSSKQ
jgi:hypothetical protein